MEAGDKTEDMEKSPLKQVEKGELKPKVLELYDQLFDNNVKKSNKYWNEFFLLRCNVPALVNILEPLSPDYLLQNTSTTRTLFKQAVEFLYSKDLAVVDNTLVIMMVFLQQVYGKPFVNYSADVIDVLVGLKQVDVRFDALLEAFSLVIMKAPSLNTRVSAIRTATVAAGGAFQTSLGDIFTHKDMMFKAIMSFTRDEGTEMYVGDAFSLVGILASFDKLESVNPYRRRLADFVDDKTMKKIVDACGSTWNICLDHYSQEFLTTAAITTSPSASTFSLTGWFTSSSNGNKHDNNNKKIVDPHATISLMLAVFEFVNVNKVFARLFVGISSNEQFIKFITLSSWLYQTQHRSSIARVYARISLMIMRILIEDGGAPASRALVDHEHVIPICQLKQLSSYSLLPQVKNPRLLIEGILDSLQCALRFNTKRTLDHEMYVLTLTTVFQIIAYLRTSKIRVNYHWSELWRTLLSLVKFLSSSSANNNSNSNNNSETSEQPHTTARLLALVMSTCLIHGDTIFPDSKQYDDIFYKLIGHSGEIEKFSKLYFKIPTPSISVLTAACDHYKQLLTKQQQQKNKTFSANEVAQVIKQGYNTLSLHQYASEGASNGNSNNNSNETAYLLYDSLPRFKEADERLFFKQATRTVITNVQTLYA